MEWKGSRRGFLNRGGWPILFILTTEGRFLKGADFLFNAWRKGGPPAETMETQDDRRFRACH
jgi:hypothetical protein